MTNPNRVHEIKPVPGLSADKVSAVTFHRNGVIGNIWFGLQDGSILVCPLPRTDSAPLQIAVRMITPRANFHVHALYASDQPSGILAHWLAGIGQAGPVELIFPGGIRTRVCNEANFAQLSVKRREPKVAIVRQKDIQIYSFLSYALKQEFVHSASSPITAFALGDDCFVYCSGNQYFIYQFSNKSISQLNSALVDTTKQWVSPLSGNSFVLRYKEFVLIAGVSNDKGQILKTNPSYGVPGRILPAKDAVYLFYDKFFTRNLVVQTDLTEATVFEIPDVSNMVMVDDTLLVVNSNQIQIVGSIPPANELARSIVQNGPDEFDSILSKLARDARSEAAFTVFCELWKMEKYELAFQVVSKHLIIGNIATLISLVPIITLFGTPNPDVKLTPRPRDNSSLVKVLRDFLNFHHSEYSKETSEVFTRELPVIDTALAQCYGLLVECRELDRILQAGNVNIPHVLAYLRDNQTTFPTSSGYAVVLTNKNEISEAMRIWQGLDKVLAGKNQTNEMLITEAAYTVRGVRDRDLLKGYLDWIYNRDPHRPAAVIIAMMSPYHDHETIIQWLHAHNLYDNNILLKYNCFLVRQPKNARAGMIAHDVLCSLLDLLTDIDKPEFTIDRLNFLDMEFSDKNEGKAEVERIILYLLKTYPDSVTAETALEHVGPSISRSIKLAIYRAKEMYEEAITLLQSDTSARFSFDEAAAFCTEAVDPPAAFSVLLKQIGVASIIENYAESLEASLPWMNVIELVQLIPPDTSMTKISSILKSAFNLLLQRKLNLDTQLGLSQSLLADSRYRKSQLQSGYCTIQRGMRCAGCGQALGDDAQLAMPPGQNDGPVYHMRCKPPLKQ